MDGDASRAVKNVQHASDEDLRPWLEKFKPTTWSVKKTEAIDFTKPFLWFDDDCFSGEKVDLKLNNAENSWVEINLSKFPDQMKHEIKLLQTIVDDVS